MSRDPGRPLGAARVLALLAAWALAIAGAGFVVLHAVPDIQLMNRLTVMLAAAIPFGTLAWALSLVLFAMAGRGYGKLLALVTVPGLIAQLLWSAAYIPAFDPPNDRSGVSVMTLNARCRTLGEEDLPATVQEIEPDLLVIQGFTRSLRVLLGESGALEPYDHSAFFPMASGISCGTAVYSALPLAETADSTAEQPAVLVEAENRAFVLVPVDAQGPQDGVPAWLDDLAGVREIAARHTEAGESVVVAGDFNAVREHVPLRNLEADGLVNAAEAVGAG